jgi:hypothetical protein
MYRRRIGGAALMAALFLILPIISIAMQNDFSADERENVLWREPDDIKARDLYYGIGGQENVPQEPYFFINEDLSGTTPKYRIRDTNGIRWQVKLGVEARPETAASRILWAVGYTTAYYYYFPEIHVENLPEHLQRGQNMITSDGIMRQARFKRHPGKKMGYWRWKDNPFIGTREYNGLRVMMALIDNWDLKDNNTAIYRQHAKDGDTTEFYVVKDLGATFGENGFGVRASKSKGNPKSYGQSAFILKKNHGLISFATPSRPSFFNMIHPVNYVQRLKMRSIGYDIPRADAKWIGTLLAQLSIDQLHDVFQAAGYSPSQIRSYSRIVQKRIAELNNL